MSDTFDDYLTHVERALEAHAYYAALALALALPDICVSCRLPEHRPTTAQLYMRWCREYASEIDPHEVYTLRCAFLHNGTSEFSKRHRARRDTLGVQLSWRGPEPRGYMVLRVSSTDSPEQTVGLDAGGFCRGLIHGARRWRTDHGSKPMVKRSLEKLKGVRTADEPHMHVRIKAQPTQKN